MPEPVLLDTGPLVAALLRRDSNHKRCLAELQKLKQPPLTSWAVLTEAVWLLRFASKAVNSLFGLMERREIRLPPIGEESADYLAKFLSRYESIGADLADATLIYLAEREGIDTVLTLDHRDFSVYRTTRGQALRIVPEG